MSGITTGFARDIRGEATYLGTHAFRTHSQAAFRGTSLRSCFQKKTSYFRDLYFFVLKKSSILKLKGRFFPFNFFSVFYSKWKYLSYLRSDCKKKSAHIKYAAYLKKMFHPPSLSALLSTHMSENAHLLPS